MGGDGGGGEVEHRISIQGSTRLAGAINFQKSVSTGSVCAWSGEGAGSREEPARDLEINDIHGTPPHPDLLTSGATERRELTCIQIPYLA